MHSVEKMLRRKWLWHYLPIVKIWMLFVFVHISSGGRFKERVNLCHLSKECL